MTPRAGVTLVELIVVLALGSGLAALMLSMVMRQHRFHTGVSAVLEGKRSTRDAAELLARELRSLSAAGADIYSMSDSAITFRAHLGASVVCAVDDTRTTIALPAASGRINERLTTFLAYPRAGDSLVIFDRGATPSASDDVWHRFALSANPGTGYCPLRPGGLAASDAESAAALSLQLAGAVPATIDVGAPVHFFRPTTYSLYRTSTGDWTLGSSTCAAGSCAVRQPVSGPYQAPSSGAPRGLELQYFDASGAQTTDPGAVARIDIIARTRTASPLDLAHVRRASYRDSLATSIAVRNRL